MGQEAALRRVRSVKVIVTGGTDELKSLGLSADIVKTDIELALRTARVPVLQGDGWPAGSPKTFLVASVVSVESPTDPVHAVGIKLQLWNLITGESPLYVAIWDAWSVALLGDVVVRQSVRDAFVDHAKTFANDFLASRP